MTQHDGAAEDVLAYHRAFPHVPVGGKACAVLRRSLPGTSAVGRLAFYEERHILMENTRCNAVRDHAFCAWAPRTAIGDADRRVEQALRVGRVSALAAL